MEETTHQTSQARIEANRRNAQKSTGPRTPEGKAKSSRNRLVHGLRANKHLILDDDPADFLLLLQDFIDRFQPVGEVKRTRPAHGRLSMAPRLRLHHGSRPLPRTPPDHRRTGCLPPARLRRGSAGCCRSRPTRPAPASRTRSRGPPGPRLQPRLHGPRSITTLTRYETSIERTLDRCIRRLKSLQADRQATPAGPEPDTPSANPTAPTESNYHSNPANEGIQETRNLSPTTHNPPPTTGAKRPSAPTAPGCGKVAPQIRDLTMKVLSSVFLSIFLVNLQASQNLDRARQLEESGDGPGARALLQHAAQASPGNIAALTEYAEFLDSHADPATAEAYAKLLDALDQPANPQAPRGYCAAPGRIVALKRRPGRRHALSGDLSHRRRPAPGSAALPSGPPANPADQYVEIPGPLHSFGRMAAISSDAQPTMCCPRWRATWSPMVSRRPTATKRWSRPSISNWCIAISPRRARSRSSPAR